ncbi:hypothetical protein NEOLI_002226 [Neolecta irregularis DAH-3]|uniref:Retrotransposon gag domain-containing protein n=1 Tax=Neolecta irregularis (strain DAH-3) TaxID=1198029 RepID=A0A1U7LRR6_NEOID|nr:hypothetical protein NEOLI_002226 [Neolecta irregularis DAH-3]|eukprot:OLL25211.1 hypothetical protein NEOLI_002226 [Neolecta irregularis DAH-3]
MVEFVVFTGCPKIDKFTADRWILKLELHWEFLQRPPGCSFARVALFFRLLNTHLQGIAAEWADTNPTFKDLLQLSAPSEKDRQRLVHAFIERFTTPKKYIDAEISELGQGQDESLYEYYRRAEVILYRAGVGNVCLTYNTATAAEAMASRQVATAFLKGLSNEELRYSVGRESLDKPLFEIYESCERLSHLQQGASRREVKTPGSTPVKNKTEIVDEEDRGCASVDGVSDKETTVHKTESRIGETQNFSNSQEHQQPFNFSFPAPDPARSDANSFRQGSLHARHSFASPSPPNESIVPVTAEQPAVVKTLSRATSLHRRSASHLEERLDTPSGRLPPAEDLFDKLPTPLIAAAGDLPGTLMEFAPDTIATGRESPKKKRKAKKSKNALVGLFNRTSTVVDRSVAA